jgi:outer membrane protein OmpA-like peptidoglycan-associated protein/tetratricopeptide (TPR) repeat protein
MRIVRRFFVFILISATLTSSGQYTKEFKRLFHDASYLLETGFYEEAYNRYKNLLILDPGNCNILFHCGVCCLSIQGLELEALTHLKKSVKCSTPDYRDNAPDETRSPILTYFMLGRAYHLNYEFDLAVENYNKYLEYEGDEDPLQVDFARLQIEACVRADSLMDQPPSFEFQNVLDHFDEYLPSCSNPVISGDGNTLIFLVDYPSDKKIMITKRKEEFWTKPEVINNEIGMVGETYPVSLSYDGMDLYLAHEYYSHSDILVSTFEEGAWSRAKALGGNINGRTSETHASISKDGTTLYFTSDVRGGMGSMDIYVSTLNGKGEWGAPKNLGPVINTKYEEHTPFISSNDSILFFSSQGHASIGGVDVFYTELNEDGTWGEPKNLGYPVNTTGDDMFFNPGWDELDGYYAVRREEDPTSNTINMVIELEPEPEEIAVVTEPDDSTVEMAAVPEPEDYTEELVLVSEPVDSTLDTEIPSIEMVIEPPETDDIVVVVNRDAERPDEQPVEQPDEITVETTVQAPATLSELHAYIPFNHNSYELNLAAQVEVEKITDLLWANPEFKIELTGHTDATGPPEYNILLSMQRVDTIAQYLNQQGIDPERVSINAKGEGAPVARNQNPDGSDVPLGRYLNRHVSVRIIGQVPADAGLYGMYVPISLRPDPDMREADQLQTFTFTVQVMADFRPVNPSHFQEIGLVKEYICKDGYYRYTFGSFQSVHKALEVLREMRKKGFPDAYIQTQEYYQIVTR